MSAFRALPSVDQLLKGLPSLIDTHGRQAVTAAARARLDAARAAIHHGAAAEIEAARLPHLLAADLAAAAATQLRPILNLTGTVLHTNLGRAILAEPAIQAACPYSTSEASTPTPTGHATPVPPSPQYPFGTLCRCCWW